MKMKRLLWLCALPLLCLSSAWGEPPSDADVTAKLIGSWDFEQDGVKGTDTFKNDGTFKGFANGAVQGTQINVSVEGKWSVKDGVLTEVITKSNHPEFVPVGGITHDKITELTDKGYKATTEHGTVEKHVRHLS